MYKRGGSSNIIRHNKYLTNPKHSYANPALVFVLNHSQQPAYFINSKHNLQYQTLYIYFHKTYNQTHTIKLDFRLFLPSLLQASIPIFLSQNSHGKETLVLRHVAKPVKYCSYNCSKSTPERERGREREYQVRLYLQNPRGFFFCSLLELSCSTTGSALEPKNGKQVNKAL